MRKMVYVYRGEASKGEEVIAFLSGDPFVNELKEEVNEALSSLRMLAWSRDCLFLPEDYEPTNVDLDATGHFDYSSWEPLAASLKDEVTSVLLLKKNDRRFALVIDLKTKEIKAEIHGAFGVEEEGEVLDSDTLLETIGYKEESVISKPIFEPSKRTTKPVNLDVPPEPIEQEDDVDFEAIAAVARPSFEGNKKKKFAPSPSKVIEAEEEEENDEPQEVNLIVFQGNFQGNSNKKPMVLRDHRPEPNRFQKEEIEKEDVQEEPTIVDVSSFKGDFQGNGKKPKDLNKRKETSKKKAPEIKAKDEEKPKIAESKIEKPNVEQKAPAPAPSSPVNKAPASDSENVSSPIPTKEDVLTPKNTGLSPIYRFFIYRNLNSAALAFHSVLEADDSFVYGESYLLDRLSKFESLEILGTTAFSPLLPEKGSSVYDHFSSFHSDEWMVVAFYGEPGKMSSALLLNKEDLTLSAVIRFLGASFSLFAVILGNVGFEDPSLNYRRLQEAALLRSEGIEE